MATVKYKAANIIAILGHHFLFLSQCPKCTNITSHVSIVKTCSYSIYLHHAPHTKYINTNSVRLRCVTIT